MVYLYVGANLHINPLKLLLNPSQNIIFVDSLPKNQYGYEYNKKTKDLYNKNFYSDLIYKFKQFKYKLIHLKKLDSIRQIEKNGCLNIKPKNLFLEPTLLIFYNKFLKKKVKYYISSALPRYLSHELILDLRCCDKLILSGFIPDSCILHYMKTPLYIYTYSNTNYNFYPEEDDFKEYREKVLYSFIQKPNTYIKKIFFVHNEHIIQECKNFDEVDKKNNEYL